MSRRDRDPGPDGPPPPTYRPLPAANPVRATDLDAGGVQGRTRPDRLTGVLTIEVVAVTPIRIGSGVAEQTEGRNRTTEIVGGVVHLRDRPAIPGSSLKGALRSLCEAIGGGCDERNCAPTCVVCALFGRVGDRVGDRERPTLMGRIGFADLRMVGDGRVVGRALPRAFAPRKRVGRRLYDEVPPASDATGPTIPLDVAVRGTRFRGELTLANVTEPELGLVLLAAGMDHSFKLRIGGGKYAGLGVVDVSVVAARLRRSYIVPTLETLDGAACQALVERCLGVAAIAPGGDRTLAVLRGGSAGGAP